MKILALNGSPKNNGASATIMSALNAKLAAKGHGVKRYDLNSLEMRGCQECYVCKKKKTDRCCIQDGLAGPLEDMKSVDAVVVATPVFYGDVSAQLKCFIDRTWSYFCGEGFSAGHLPRGRKLVFIMSYGYDDPSIYDALWERYRMYFNLFGFDECRLIKAYGAVHQAPEIHNREEAEGLVEAAAAAFGQA